MYGFGFALGWKNLSLTAMFQGAAHVDAMLSGEGVLPFSQGSSRGNLLSNITAVSYTHLIRPSYP